VALIIAFMVVGTLITLSTGFVLSTVTELRTAQHYKNSTTAFWTASSGLNQFLSDTHYLDSGAKTIYFGSNYVTVTKTDGASQRVVQAIAHVGSSQRGIEVTFPANPPDLFSNTMTSGKDFNLTGLLARLDSNGKTRIGGQYNKSGFASTGNFQDKQENLGITPTTLKYPDANGNGTSDEFADFVQYYRAQVASYPADQVVWVQTNNSVLVYPNQYLQGKKIIFVESTNPGGGDVSILFDASWRNDENLTIVSTGDITYLQPLQNGVNSKLNLVSWNNYNEASILYSAHQGVMYAHDDADFFSVLSYSHTTGNVIANGNINALEALTWKVFDYNNPIDASGNGPPGFSGLIAQRSSGYASKPASWREI
jgi:hypothetical protein